MVRGGFSGKTIFFFQNYFISKEFVMEIILVVTLLVAYFMAGVDTS